MNIKSVRHGLFLCTFLISVGFALPVAAQHGGGGRGGGGHVGGPGHGGSSGHGGGGIRGGGGWGGGGAGWWGLGLGLGLGWDAAYLSGVYPYYPYPYPYPYPVYEYPDVGPAVIVNPALPVAPPGMAVVPPSSAPAQNWYYCDSAKTFYPYVTQCPESWRMVPAVPPAPVR